MKRDNLYSCLCGGLLAFCIGFGGVACMVTGLNLSAQLPVLAMGCTIGGDRLGLGTNLFSARNTLMEEMGYSRLCAELSKKSQYYSDHFYGEIKEVIPTTAPTTTGP